MTPTMWGVLAMVAWIGLGITAVAWTFFRGVHADTKTASNLWLAAMIVTYLAIPTVPALVGLYGQNVGWWR